jgi:peptidase, M16 family
MLKAPEPTLTTLPGGLRLVHLHQRSAGSGIFGISVRTGSADEKQGKEGLAHFVEHTIFKGTQRRSSWHIINRMEAVGGELNAFTSKEETVVYSIFPSGNAPRAIELIADLAANSQFPAHELEKEREVVIDEINSYLDTPSEAIFDDFEEEAFNGCALAHNILGNADSVRKLTGADCREFLADNYRSGNIVAFYSGPQSQAHIESLVERYFAALPQGEKNGTTAANNAVLYHDFDQTRRLDIHQAHVVLGTQTPGICDAGRHAVSLFANIIGGPGMNSLLNVELRERRGLVYSVEASTSVFTTCGLITVYFGCDAEDVSRCRDICTRVFRNIADGKFTERHLAKAKKQYLGQLAVASENRENRIMAAARAASFRGEISDLVMATDAINSVSVNDIQALANKMAEASALIFTSSVY